MAKQCVTKNRNATPSAFGWDFQFNAAIMIMLDSIQEAKAIKVEGETEDIEVFLDNGKVIFAQAKSCMIPEDSSHALRDLKKALTSLSDASQTGVAQSLIFITNRCNPFNNISTMHRFAKGESHVLYSDLPIVCKEQIEKIAGDQNLSLTKELFSVYVFDFSGEEINRYRIVKQRVVEFLASLECECEGWAQKIMDRWQLAFGKNASSHKTRISKQDMIWPLIVWRCSRITSDMLQEFDEAECDDIEFNYKKIIDEASERFEFVARVMAEYANFRCENQGMSRKECVSRFKDAYCMSFQDEFDLEELDEDRKRAVLGLVVEKILRDRINIKKIKEAVNL